MSASARPSPPDSLRGLPERYELRRHLATGGMAAVWCAEDRVLGRQVAIKVLSKRYADDEQAIRRFKREARAAARVSAHPHVVTIYDVGDLEDAPAHAHDQPGGAFIVMEYLAGGTVADALRHGAVTEEETRRWLRDAAEALDHAHARGIVHRDIKPANFLLDQGRRLHVADFGIARLASEETITTAGEVFGTAAYLAPEQALGHDADPASDRYALAIAAFELLTGGRPFTATNFAAQARQHIDEEPPRARERNPELPPDVDDVLARGMAKDPQERYPSAVAFVSALEAALDSAPTVATAPLAAGVQAATAISPPRRAVTPAISRPRATAVGAAAVGAAAAGAGADGGGDHGWSPRSGAGRPVPAPRAGRGRMLALLALGLVALGVVVAIASLGGGGSHQSSTRQATAPTTPRTTAKPARHRAAPASTSASSSAVADATSTASATSTPAASATSPTSATTPASTGSASAQQLQLQGYHFRLAGNYPAAIATDRQALAAADPSSLTYAYALYDLGVSLLNSGNPQAAIPYLQQRLRYANQTATVQATLDQALQAAGRTPGGQGGGNGNGGGGNGGGN